MDRVDTGQKDREVVQEIEKGPRRKPPDLVFQTAYHTCKKRNGKERHRRESVSARGAAPFRHRHKVQRILVAGEVQHAGETNVPKNRKHAAESRHERQQIQKNEQELNGFHQRHEIVLVSVPRL